MDKTTTKRSPADGSLTMTAHAAGVQVGDPVACMSYGSFSDYQLIPARQAMPVPVVAPEIVALLTSGLTASIGELIVMGSVLEGCHAQSGSCYHGLSFTKVPHKHC